jgi:hypothetical protein
MTACGTIADGLARAARRSNSNHQASRIVSVWRMVNQQSQVVTGEGQAVAHRDKRRAGCDQIGSKRERRSHVNG